MSQRGKAWLAVLAALLCISFFPTRLSASEDVIKGLEIRPYGRGAALAVARSGASPLQLTSFELEGPSRLIIDIKRAILAAGVPAEIAVGRAGISRIRAGQFSLNPKVVRLVCDLEEGAKIPEWNTIYLQKEGRMLLNFSGSGPLELASPEVTQEGEAHLLRIGGAAGRVVRAAALEAPARVYIDIADAVVGESKQLDYASGAIRQIRLGQQSASPDASVARMVIEFREKQAYAVYRDGLDLMVATGPRAWALPLGEYEPTGALQGKRIVIDPGHGGKDTGAPAPTKADQEPLLEKDLVLDMGQRLAKLAQAEGAEVTMTREKDVYIGLKERAALANKLKADALVSIHCDSCPTPDTLQGTSVYYDHEHSRQFAQMMQDELVAALGTEDRGIRNANFAVIRRATRPGVLVETAYINHARDRKRLADPDFRERAARAMLRGMIQFAK